MKTQDIKNMGHAYLSVLEAMKKKLDPVDKDELKGDHKDRKDKDIDNDGDADESDAYLHNRRKTISKASKGKEVETTESVEEAKKVITAKQIKNALSSAKAQAKPKDQVSLKKAPFDIPKEGKEWTVLNRIQEKADTKISHTKGATEPEKMGSTASKGEMGFVDAHGGLTGTDAAIDGAKAAEFTANAATKNVKVAPGRPNDQKGGDKNIVKAGTEVKESALARLKNYIRR